MNRLRAAAVAAFALALVLLAYGAMEGDVRLALFLIFPVLYGSGPLAALGMLLLFAAIVLWIFGSLGAMPRVLDAPPPAERRSGGVVLLGPIPIVWGSDRRILPWMVAAGLALLLLGLAAWWLLGG